MQQAQLETSLSKPSKSGKGGSGGPKPRSPLSLRELGFRLLGLAVVDAVAIWFITSLVSDNLTLAAVVLGIITIGINWIFLDNRVYPLRWLTPGVFLLLLMVVYPALYLLYTSFTNYGDNHRLSRDQVVAQLKDQTYAPASAATYTWTAYRNAANQYKIILVNKDNGKAFIGDQSGLQPYTAPATLPATIDDYQKLTSFQAAAAGNQLQALNLKSKGSDGLTIQIVSSTQAKELASKYTFDAGSGNLTDNETKTVYSPQKGFFTAPDGKTIGAGFTDTVGFENYAKVFSDGNITGPFFRVFLWTVIFAALTVVFSFAIGLGLALVLNDDQLPLRTFFRSLIFIPYAIPSFISALVWAGLFSITGPLGLFGKSLFNESFTWFADPTWARVVIIFVNVWLGFPYMMVISLGALQSIPTDMYEAARIDGASRWQQFWSLTFPLLLVSVAPLLISSFAFNFNNFNIIELLNKGGPPDPSTTTPAGQTDILISYTYRLAFASGKGADLGLGATISIFIFLLIAAITAFNFRFTRQLEEVFN